MVAMFTVTGVPSTGWRCPTNRLAFTRAYNPCANTNEARRSRGTCAPECPGSPCATSHARQEPRCAINSSSQELAPRLEGSRRTAASPCSKPCCASHSIPNAEQFSSSAAKTRATLPRPRVPCVQREIARSAAAIAPFMSALPRP